MRRLLAACALASALLAPRVRAECIDLDEDRVGGGVGNEVIVELRDGVDFVALAQAEGCAPLGWIPQIRCGLLGVPAGRTPDDVVADLEQNHASEIRDADAHRAIEDPEGVQQSIPALEVGLSRNQFQTQPAAQLTHVAQATATLTGASVVVAVVDTGVSSTNPELAGSLVSSGLSVLAGETSADVPPNGIDDDGDGAIDEMAGHGTHVAGMVLLVAPGARILPIRVLNDDGRGTSFDLARGIVAGVDAGADLVNLSLGLAHDARAVERAIEYAAAHDVLIVAAAGNRGLQCVDVPADRTEALAVAAVDDTFVKPAWSSCGPEVGLSAPGVATLSMHDAVNWSHWDGTSFAAPMVTGGAALLLQAHPELHARDVKATMKLCTQPDANVSPIRELMGTGVLDLATIATVTPVIAGGLTLAEQADGTHVDAGSIDGATGYDVARGLVSELRLEGDHVSLGALTCLLDDAPSASVVDPAHPPAGDVFFYVMRDDAFETDNGAWGFYADGIPRLAASGDCTF